LLLFYEPPKKRSASKGWISKGSNLFPVQARKIGMRKVLFARFFLQEKAYIKQLFRINPNKMNFPLE